MVATMCHQCHKIPHYLCVTLPVRKTKSMGPGPATPVTQALSDMRLPTSRRVLERMTASTWFVNVRAASLLWH